jgi:hypothetical protein
MTTVRPEDCKSVDMLLDELEQLLKRQIASVQTGKLSAVEPLARQVGQISARLAAEGVLDCPAFAAKTRRLRNLNHRLCVMLAAEKQQTNEQLCQVRRSRRALRVYYKNLAGLI